MTTAPERHRTVVTVENSDGTEVELETVHLREGEFPERAQFFNVTAIDHTLPGNARALLMGRFAEDSVVHLKREAEKAGVGYTIDWDSLKFYQRTQAAELRGAGPIFEVWHFTVEADRRG